MQDPKPLPKEVGATKGSPAATPRAARPVSILNPNAAVFAPGGGGLMKVTATATGTTFPITTVNPDPKLTFGSFEEEKLKRESIEDVLAQSVANPFGLLPEQTMPLEPTMPLETVVDITRKNKVHALLTLPARGYVEALDAAQQLLSRVFSAQATAAVAGPPRARAADEPDRDGQLAVHRAVGVLVDRREEADYHE
jgi:hypothetical protein